MKKVAQCRDYHSRRVGLGLLIVTTGVWFQHCVNYEYYYECNSQSTANGRCIKRTLHQPLSNLPGTGETVIKEAVLPHGGWCIALRLAEVCDLPKRGRLGCVIFVRGR